MKRFVEEATKNLYNGTRWKKASMYLITSLGRSVNFPWRVNLPLHRSSDRALWCAKERMDA